MRRILLFALTVVLATACETGQPSLGQSVTAPPSTAPPSTAPHSVEQADTADFGNFGPYRVGMTADEVRAIAGGQLGEEPAEVSGVCHQFIDTRYNSDPGDGMIILLTRDVGYRVVGIRPPIYAKTSRGIGFGHDKDEIRRAYPNETITESSSQVGTEILVKDNGSDNYIGFTVGSDLHTVVGIHIGTHDFAANYELCSDG